MPTTDPLEGVILNSTNVQIEVPQLIKAVTSVTPVTAMVYSELYPKTKTAYLGYIFTGTLVSDIKPGWTLNGAIVKSNTMKAEKAVITFQTQPGTLTDDFSYNFNPPTAITPSISAIYKIPSNSTYYFPGLNVESGWYISSALIVDTNVMVGDITFRSLPLPALTQWSYTFYNPLIPIPGLTLDGGVLSSTPLLRNVKDGWFFSLNSSTYKISTVSYVLNNLAITTNPVLPENASGPVTLYPPNTIIFNYTPAPSITNVVYKRSSPEQLEITGTNFILPVVTFPGRTSSTPTVEPTKITIPDALTISWPLVVNVSTNGGKATYSYQQPNIILSFAQTSYNWTLGQPITTTSTPTITNNGIPIPFALMTYKQDVSDLPFGLQFSESTGRFTYTPGNSNVPASNKTFIITAADANGFESNSLSMTIIFNLPPEAYVNSPINVSKSELTNINQRILTIIGGVPPMSFTSVLQGTTTNGELTINSNGVLTGIVRNTSETYTITIIDNNGANSVSAYDVTINTYDSPAGMATQNYTVGQILSDKRILLYAESATSYSIGTGSAVMDQARITYEGNLPGIEYGLLKGTVAMPSNTYQGVSTDANGVESFQAQFRALDSNGNQITALVVDFSIHITPSWTNSAINYTINTAVIPNQTGKFAISNGFGNKTYDINGNTYTLENLITTLNNLTPGVFTISAKDANQVLATGPPTFTIYGTPAWNSPIDYTIDKNSVRTANQTGKFTIGGFGSAAYSFSGTSYVLSSLITMLNNLNTIPSSPSITAKDANEVPATGTPTFRIYSMPTATLSTTFPPYVCYDATISTPVTPFTITGGFTTTIQSTDAVTILNNTIYSSLASGTIFIQDLNTVKGNIIAPIYTYEFYDSAGTTLSITVTQPTVTTSSLSVVSGSPPASLIVHVVGTTTTSGLSDKKGQFFNATYTSPTLTLNKQQIIFTASQDYTLLFKSRPTLSRSQTPVLNFTIGQTTLFPDLNLTANSAIYDKFLSGFPSGLQFTSSTSLAFTSSSGISGASPTGAPTSKTGNIWYTDGYNYGSNIISISYLLYSAPTFEPTLTSYTISNPAIPDNQKNTITSKIKANAYIQNIKYNNDTRDNLITTLNALSITTYPVSLTDANNVTGASTSLTIYRTPTFTGLTGESITIKTQVSITGVQIVMTNGTSIGNGTGTNLKTGTMTSPGGGSITGPNDEITSTLTNGTLTTDGTKTGTISNITATPIISGTITSGTLTNATITGVLTGGIRSTPGGISTLTGSTITQQTGGKINGCTIATGTTTTLTTGTINNVQTSSTDTIPTGTISGSVGVNETMSGTITCPGKILITSTGGINPTSITNITGTITIGSTSGGIISFTHSLTGFINGSSITIQNSTDFPAGSVINGHLFKIYGIINGAEITINGTIIGTFSPTALSENYRIEISAGSINITSEQSTTTSTGSLSLSETTTITINVGTPTNGEIRLKQAGSITDVIITGGKITGNITGALADNTPGSFTGSFTDGGTTDISGTINATVTTNVTISSGNIMGTLLTGITSLTGTGISVGATTSTATVINNAYYITRSTRISINDSSAPENRIFRYTSGSISGNGVINKIEVVDYSNSLVNLPPSFAISGGLANSNGYSSPSTKVEFSSNKIKAKGTLVASGIMFIVPTNLVNDDTITYLTYVRTSQSPGIDETTVTYTDGNGVKTNPFTIYTLSFTSDGTVI